MEKTRGTCTRDQGSGATPGVLGYASAQTISISKRTSEEEKQTNPVKADHRMPQRPNDRELQTQIA